MDDHGSSDIDTLIETARSATVAVASCDLAGDATLLRHADEPFHPASTMKVCVLMEVWRQAEAGQLSLDEWLPVHNTFQSLVGGEYGLDPAEDSELGLYGRIGRTATIRELARLMIVVSSNLATNLLIDRVGATAVTGFMRELGAPSLMVVRGLDDDAAHDRGLDNVATARGLMHVMGRLARGEVVTPAASAEMVEILAAQTFNEGIPAGLPGGIRVAHKTGWITATYHDAGIVFPPDGEPYVLVVLTRGIADEARAHDLVAGISRVVWAAHRRGRDRAV